jgi:quercetin dioxygenase-like cupin family protein
MSETTSVRPAAGVRQFARRMLRDGVSITHPGLQPMRCMPGWLELVLHRAGPWQISLTVVLPGAPVPPHRHLRCDSCDLGLAGSGTLDVLPRWRDVPLGAQLISVPRGAWHGGHAGPDGAAWLSFQHWHGEPGFLSDDWEAAP